MSPTDQIKSAINGLRILIVEDNYLLAHELAAILTECECEVVGPASGVDEGLQLIQSTQIDGAILDVHVRGGTCEPIALQLMQQKRPFFFITGFASPMLREPALLKAIKLNKPVDADTLLRTMVSVFKGRDEAA